VSAPLVPPDRHDERLSLGQAVVLGLAAAIAVLVLVVVPPSRLLGSVFAADEAPRRIAADPGAFGASGDVWLHPKLPGELFDFPFDSAAPPPGTRYQWVRAADSGAVSLDTALTGSTVRAPRRAGLYYLAVRGNGGRTVLGDIIVAVLVPFDEKLGSSLNGYRIGTYRWERAPGDATRPPAGFLEVWPADVNLQVSAHMRLADFITHDAQQDRWPKYVALDRKVLDKVELVLDRLGGRERILDVSVHSGFRTPLHNRRVPRAASDSRHQYGDAVDLALDADGDGRVSFFDVLAVARAVDVVEQAHPGLAGGLGLYGNRGNAPYVHIDVRGERKRWRG
jgi:uncharacterized protein YcbK (DUF882 family)